MKDNEYAPLDEDERVVLKRSLEKSIFEVVHMPKDFFSLPEPRWWHRHHTNKSKYRKQI